MWEDAIFVYIFGAMLYCGVFPSGSDSIFRKILYFVFWPLQLISDLLLIAIIVIARWFRL